MPLDLSCCSIIRHPWKRIDAINYKQLASVDANGAMECPFCKSKNLDFVEIYEENKILWSARVHCSNCLTDGPVANRLHKGDLHKIAVEKWNKRGKK